MLNRKIYKPFFFSTCLAFLLSNCGGTSKTAEEVYKIEEISGIAMDEYLPHVRVCFDLNDNKVCDTNEPQTYTDENGEFNLEVPANEVNKHKVIVETDKFSLTSLTDKYNVISPLTTVIARLTEKGYNDTIAKKVMSKLVYNKVEEESWTEDYIKEENKLLQEFAKTLTYIIEKSEEILNLNNNDSDTEKTELFNAILDIIIHNFPDIYISLDNSTEDNSTDIVNDILTEISNSTDIETFIKEKENELSGISTLLGKDIYNFVIDCKDKDNCDGTHYIKLNKIHFSSYEEIRNGKGQVLYYSFPIDNSTTGDSLDITVNSTDDISKWELKNKEPLKIENNKLVFKDVEGNPVSIVAVGKANLKDKKLNKDFIFPFDYESELEVLGLQGFNVNFNEGNMYIITTTDEFGNVNTIYAFDKEAANQIINTLKQYQSGSSGE